MRWPWRRRGRRRSSDALPLVQIDPWAASWGDTFLPQLPLPLPPQPPHRSAVVESLPTSTVRLGFSDGTELELDESSGESRALRDIAATLTRRSSA
jgi:hypothetical protein